MDRQESARVFGDTFKLFDLDGNGTIDIKELELGLSKGYGDVDLSLCAGALQDLLKKFDANGNGVLERDEFVELMHSAELEEFFAREDAKAQKETGTALDLDSIYDLSPTPEETPALIKEKLAEFEEAFDKIDAKKKKTCTMAQERCPDLCRDDFKLAFLRCEVFNVAPAVDRWIKYWDVRLAFFGEDRAFLPMTLEGAMKGREKAISSTYYRVAEGVTDPDGRAILLADFREERGDLSDDDLVMAAFYQHHVILSSESAQKRGAVYWCRGGERLSDGRQAVRKRCTSFKGAIPVRISAFHVAMPPFYVKVVVKIAKVFLGPKIRKRIYIHSGSTDAVLKSASKFGLGSKDKLPEVFGGDLSFSPPAKLTFLC